MTEEELMRFIPEGFELVSQTVDINLPCYDKCNPVTGSIKMAPVGSVQWRECPMEVVG